jgi:uncharacterized membrane protein
MNNVIARGIATISSAVFAIVLVNAIFYFFKVDDHALLLTFVALASASTSIEIYRKLSV